MVEQIADRNGVEDEGPKILLGNDADVVAPSSSGQLSPEHSPGEGSGRRAFLPGLFDLDRAGDRQASAPGDIPDAAIDSNIAWTPSLTR